MIACRLCKANAENAFDCLILGKYDVALFKCSRCGCLQTEQPYWLEEAYSAGNLTDRDTGSVIRNLNSQALIFAATKILGFPAGASIVDFGGGTGMLTRLLRDQGFDARCYDRYASNDLARGYDDNGGRPDIICSFEVAEHLVEPAEELAALFKRCARMVIIGTETYRGQGPGWWYLSPHTGQHIFFYTSEGMALIAGQFGYHYERIGSTHFFCDRPMTKLQGRVLWRALTPLGLRFVRAWLAFRLDNRFVGRDWEAAQKSR